MKVCVAQSILSSVGFFAPHLPALACSARFRLLCFAWRRPALTLFRFDVLALLGVAQSLPGFVLIGFDLLWYLDFESTPCTVGCQNQISRLERFNKTQTHKPNCDFCKYRRLDMMISTRPAMDLAVLLQIWLDVVTDLAALVMELVVFMTHLPAGESWK